MSKTEQYFKNKFPLNDLQKFVIEQNGTEQAFNNQYWNHKEEGIYVDASSGEPLFLSLDKFDSHSGWPSFTKPIDENLIVKNLDNSHGMYRVEVRSKIADSHLGHVFDDGPIGLGGLRYCINSASLKFIAKNDLEQAGYSQFKKYFKK